MMTRASPIGVVIENRDDRRYERLGCELCGVIEEWTHGLPEGVRDAIALAIDDIMAQVVRPGQAGEMLEAFLLELAHELSLYNDTQDAEVLGHAMYEAVMAKLIESAIAA